MQELQLVRGICDHEMSIAGLLNSHPIRLEGFHSFRTVRGFLISHGVRTVKTTHN